MLLLLLLALPCALVGILLLALAESVGVAVAGRLVAVARRRRRRPELGLGVGVIAACCLVDGGTRIPDAAHCARRRVAREEGQQPGPHVVVVVLGASLGSGLVGPRLLRASRRLRLAISLRA